jgi:hypothetical protein
MIYENRGRICSAGLPIIAEPEPPERMLREILALARKHQLSTCDASDLDLAIRPEVPLATLVSGLSTSDSGRTKRPAILKG